MNQQQIILQRIADLFAPEDETLRHVREEARAAGLPDIHISPLQGKLLHFLAKACNAQRILEIGTLAGYSGIWLARALPDDGRLITVEIDPTRADIAQLSFRYAGLRDKTEIRVGNAADILLQLQEPVFDLIFIDADKPNYPQYLNLALLVSHPGTIIIADNCLPGGSILRYPEPGSEEAVQEYCSHVANEPSLVSLSLPLAREYTDGFTISVVCQ